LARFDQRDLRIIDSHDGRVGGPGQEAFEQEIVAALQAHDGRALSAISQEAALSASSEIRNWIMVSHLRTDMYIPVHRTPAGTGIG